MLLLRWPLICVRECYSCNDHWPVESVLFLRWPLTCWERVTPVMTTDLLRACYSCDDHWPVESGGELRQQDELFLHLPRPFRVHHLHHAVVRPDHLQQPDLALVAHAQSEHVPHLATTAGTIPSTGKLHELTSEQENMSKDAMSRGGTIHRCIDISRYFSRDTYRDIIFYNHNFFFFFFFNILFSHNDFHLGRKDT